MSEEKKVVLPPNFGPNTLASWSKIIALLIIAILISVYFVNMVIDDSKGKFAKADTKTETRQLVESTNVIAGSDGEKVHEVIAHYNEWTKPIKIPAHHDFMTYCAGCETGKRIEIKLGDKIITTDDKPFYHLPDTKADEEIRFKSNGKKVKVILVFSPERKDDE